MANETISWLYEFIDSESPGDLTVGPGASAATLFFIVKWDKLYDIMTEILGYTTISTDTDIVGNESLGFNRRLPLSHPRNPYLYADSVEIVGVSNNGINAAEAFTYPEQIYRNKQVDPNAVEVDYRTFPYASVYKEIKIAVKFTARNYFLLTNSQLQVAINDTENNNIARRYYYWQRDKDNVNLVKSASYFDMREYLRYTEVFVEPNNEVIVNTTGKGYWKSESFNGAPVNGPVPDSVLTMENTSTNFQNITKNIIKVKWYQVPKILFQPSSNDTIRPWDYAVSMINYGGNYDEDEFNTQVFNYNFFNNAPGTLLYLGYELEDASSPFPFQSMYGDSTNLPINYLKNQYYNVTFSFMKFTIPTDQIVLPNLDLIAFKNGKMYSNGWNFVPSPNRRFYYIESDNAANARAIPPYWSFPFQAIFNPRLEITA